jgi:dihydroxyacetone kinase-like predicted kinase
VAVARGAGLERLLRDAGARVVPAGPGALPGELAALARLPGPHVLLIGGAERGQSGPLAGAWPSEWPVIEVASVIGMLAALAVHDPEHELSADAESMRRAAAGVRYASVERVAVPGRPGGAGLLGRIGDTVMATGASQAEVAGAVIDQLLASGAELVTLLTGEAAEADLGVRAAERVAAVAPAADVVRVHGGMPGTVLLIGAE